MSLGTIWLGELPVRVACSLHDTVWCSFYCLVAPITTTSGRWQNSHSNSTHPIVFAAFETCTGSFMRHNAEWGRPLVWPSLAVSVMDKLCAGPGALLCAPLSHLPESGVCSGTWWSLWCRGTGMESSSKSSPRVPSSTSYSRIPRGCTETVWSDFSLGSPIARVSHTLSKVLALSQTHRPDLWHPVLVPLFFLDLLAMVLFPLTVPLVVAVIEGPKDNSGFFI